MNSTRDLIPYWYLLFTIGFGWFMLAPLVPEVSRAFSVGTSSVLLLVSLYGYTMVVLGLLSGFISARFSVVRSLYISAALSVIGLALRIVAYNYTFLFIATLIAAVAYPMAVAPVGSVAESLTPGRAHTTVGISVGILFMGMAIGSLVSPYLIADGIREAFGVSAILALVALVVLPMRARDYPQDYRGRSLRGSFRTGMLKNWYVGFLVSSISVMFGSIASSSLIARGVPEGTALSVGGLLSALTFLGSGTGAIIVPPVFERLGRVRAGMLLTSALSAVSASTISYLLGLRPLLALLIAFFFLYGFFGNSYWSMAMTSTTYYSDDPARAGLATSMYSVATNVGVALIPVFFGPLVISGGAFQLAVLAVLFAAGVAVSPFLKLAGSGGGVPEKGPGEPVGDSR
ncbi:hypothetical protein GCM10007108_03640 [Thermogymnomonas acidicola]|uniref:Major facilitator superfamily (MFS) profile domain-containing protein n=1 Tax=Thermogymnomonas acidicola TaxID=399579 RepID=A0AA37BQ22_9ARCH|nr:MFS transporter [Thermogymnomonas acidicola]GGM68774.1 hypothetical protein GCM10007108_03640 [Thermogymnomonas acidicola]